MRQTFYTKVCYFSGEVRPHATGILQSEGFLWKGVPWTFGEESPGPSGTFYTKGSFPRYLI